MPLTDIFGQLKTRHDVEVAVIEHLRKWVPTYVAAVERSAGLPPRMIPLPPDPDESYRGGIDFNTWQTGWGVPGLITVVQPFGEPERQYSNGTYLQPFEIQVCSVVQSDDEDTARQHADYYGAAVMGALLQHGSLGTLPSGDPVSLKTVLTGFPAVSFWTPDERRVIRSIVTARALIDNVLTEAAGPVAPAANPYALPGDWPLVETVNTTISATPIS